MQHQQTPQRTPTYRLSRMIRSTLSLIALIISLPAQAGLFDTSGQFGVSPAGAANYSIPLALPPGTAGMQPSLAINYNSQGGNGLLGVGWSLSGLSAITRCPQTKVQDGYLEVALRKPIKYDATDKYCLDGQRLVLYSGTYGVDGAEYRTERESYSRIISYGTSGPGAGAGHFKVWTKAGLIMEYGSSADSQIVQQGKSSVQVWALHKVSDTKGNYYTISYQDNGKLQGEFYPTRIDYTGNVAAKLAPYNSIRFVYEARPDSPVLYDNTGSKIQSTQRLTHIQTYADTALVKDYRITYELKLSPATQRSRIASITECDSDAAGAICLLPTKITWDATGDAVGKIALGTGIGTGSWGGQFLYTGDFRGDGSAQTLTQKSTSLPANPVNPLNTWICVNKAGSEYCVSATMDGVSGSGVVGDFNSDGYADYISNGKLCLGPFSPGSLCQATTFSVGSVPIYLVDASGGGQPLAVSLRGLPLYPLQYPSDPAVFFRVVCSGPLLQSCTRTDIGISNFGSPMPPGLVGDFDADGRTDIIFPFPNNFGPLFCSGKALSDGSACLGITGGPANWAYNYVSYSGDYNGDGISDLYLIGSSDSKFCPGPGVSSSANNCVKTVTGDLKTPYATYPGDYNGDGISDLLLVGAAESKLCLGPGISKEDTTGSANANCVVKYTGNLQTGYVIRPGDYDGDGTTDLLLIAGNKRYFVESGAGKPDRVAVITTGLGASTTITYKPLTDATVYAKGTGVNVKGAGYLELQAPMYVVSSVSSSNGVGGMATTDYRYWYARIHQAGGGFMGFEYVRACDANVIPNICTQTKYTQTYPQQGLPLQVHKFALSGGKAYTLNLVNNTWSYVIADAQHLALGTSYVVPQLDLSQEVSYELASDGGAQGTAVSNVVTRNTYDGFGNPLTITVSSVDTSVTPSVVYRKTTANLYDNDTTGVNPDGSVRWLLGRLRSATVTSTTP